MHHGGGVAMSSAQSKLIIHFVQVLLDWPKTDNSLSFVAVTAASKHGAHDTVWCTEDPKRSKLDMGANPCRACCGRKHVRSVFRVTRGDGSETLDRQGLRHSKFRLNVIERNVHGLPRAQRAEETGIRCRVPHGSRAALEGECWCANVGLVRQ